MAARAHMTVVVTLAVMVAVAAVDVLPPIANFGKTPSLFRGVAPVLFSPPRLVVSRRSACTVDADCGAPTPCHAQSTCMAGVCSLAAELSNGTACTGGICEAGACINPCQGVVCVSTTCETSTCQVQAGQAVCVAVPVPDGTYALPPPPPAQAPILDTATSTNCVAGVSWCEAPLRYVARTLLDAPPLPPTDLVPCTAHADCAAPQQCFAASTCLDGYCTTPVPLAVGTPCNDSNAGTVGDVCDAAGTCTGLGMSPFCLSILHLLFIFGAFLIHSPCVPARAGPLPAARHRGACVVARARAAVPRGRDGDGQCDPG